MEAGAESRRVSRAFSVGAGMARSANRAMGRERWTWMDFLGFGIGESQEEEMGDSDQ